jgi:hypothetical protein
MTLAQTIAEPLPTTAGWVGAGLASSILAWLFFKHIPAKDAQIAKLIEDHTRLVTKLIDDHAAQNHQMMTDYQTTLDQLATRVATLDRERRDQVRESLAYISNHNEHQIAVIGKSINELVVSVRELRHAFYGDRPTEGKETLLEEDNDNH